MKSAVLSFLILILSISSNMAQEMNDSLRGDSIGLDTINLPFNHSNFDSGFKINSTDFNKGAIFSPLLLIQGKVPGFIINSMNPGDPNPNLQIQLRGTSTLFLSTEPLYIIDGIPLENPDLIPALNIESIEVLRSLAETAPYGIRGSNGVVIINTNQDHSDKLSVTYTSYAYVESFAKKSEYMSRTEWLHLKQEWESSPYSQLTNQSEKMIDYNADTDWRKEISQNKLSQAHHLGLHGGHHKTSYHALLNYNTYNGIIKKTGNSSYSGQVSISQLAIKDKLKIDLSLIGTNKKSSAINTNPYLISTDITTHLLYSNIISRSKVYNPTLPVYNSDGSYGQDTIYGSFSNAGQNPVSAMDDISDSRKLKNTLAHIQASYEIIDGLKFSTSFSRYKLTTENSFSRSYTNYYGENTQASNETITTKERIYSIQLNYNKSLGFHRINLVLNYANQFNNYEYEYVDSILNNSSLTDNDLYPIESYLTANIYMEYKIKSIIASANYNYKNKYFISLGLLQETSPLLSPIDTIQYLPSISASWSLGKEEFLKSIAFLNNLQLQVGYGLGQRPHNYNSFRSFFSTDPWTRIAPGEQMNEFNFGLKAAVLSNRLSCSVDFYHLNTEYAIYVRALPTTSDYKVIRDNDLSINNRGWEFHIKSKPVLNPITWTIDFNLLLNKNKIRSEFYVSDQDIKGQAIGNFFGFEFAGYNSKDQILFYDENGDTTSSIYYDERRMLGNGHPKSFFGFTNSFKYKNFDLSISARGALGFEIKNFDKLENHSSMNYKRTVSSIDQRDFLNAYTLSTSDYPIEKGDYIKIDNISLGYTLPLEKRYCKSLKVYFACNNVALLTNFTGADPEGAGITGIYPGYYNIGKYPRTRIFLLGLKLTL